MHGYHQRRYPDNNPNKLSLPNIVRRIPSPQELKQRRKSFRRRGYFYAFVLIIAGVSGAALSKSHIPSLAQLSGVSSQAYDIRNAVSFTYESKDNEKFGPFSTNEVITTVISEKKDKDPDPDPKPDSNTCSDGTLQKQCSTRQPLFCKDGELKDRCSSCGCPSGLTCDSESERCLEPGATLTGTVPDNYEGRVQIFVYKTERDKKLYKKTTHTQEVHLMVPDMNAEVGTGVYRVFLEVPGYDLITIDGVNFPVYAFDSKWPEFMRRAYR